jgi:hypothetical protein
MHVKVIFSQAERDNPSSWAHHGINENDVYEVLPPLGDTDKDSQGNPSVYIASPMLGVPVWVPLGKYTTINN